MHPELKWFLLAAAAIMIAAFIGQAHGDYQKNLCRVELGKANRPAAEITEICK